ncbi:MAG: TrkA C-terminal domain-containing protein, partial [Candidatus Izemoplasmatales bacterium]|nr:TrkA C-terminal domain-containing protein [Candidatus Izemoplasmatales bacterium]
PSNWVGHSIRELKIREKYRLNIIALKVNDVVTPIVNADHRFEADEHLFISGSKTDIMQLMDK